MSVDATDENEVVEKASDELARLRDIVESRWVMALATHDPHDPASPYQTPLFFSAARRESFGGAAGVALVFSSDPRSRHGQQLGAGPTRAAAAVYLETEEIGALRGAQLRGTVWRADTLDARAPGIQAGLLRSYLDRHPVAASAFEKARPPSLYLFEVTWAKITDNRLGFGVHPVWQTTTTAWNAPAGAPATEPREDER